MLDDARRFRVVNKPLPRTNASPNEFKEIYLYNQNDGFELETKDNEKHQAYTQERVNNDDDITLLSTNSSFSATRNLSRPERLEKQKIDIDLQEFPGRPSDATGDEIYTRILGGRDITSFN